MAEFPFRVLQDRTIDRVGGASPIRWDIRIIAATNRNLEEMVKQGEFREDLRFHLNVFPITIPPLRDRICSYSKYRLNIRVYFSGKRKDV